MVDAAIGGKTGVNTPHGKNMIGSFYPAKEVLIDGSFLTSLPKHELSNGIVEIIKTGLIRSPSLFKSMQNSADRFEAMDLEFIMEKVIETATIKMDIVDEDPQEKLGLRQILNFGHTFGHGLEILENHKISHGQAVAIGILCACYISENLNLLPASTLEEIRTLFQLYDIPLSLSKEHHAADMIDILKRDKKAKQSVAQLVLLKSIGQTTLVPIEHTLLEETTNWMNQNYACHT